MEAQEYARMFALEERNWWYRALRRQIFRALQTLPSPPNGSRGALRCLDAGCGTGMLLSALRIHFEGFGIDYSGLALSLATKRGLRHLAQASVEAIPLADRSLDLIISADVLYHRGVSDDVAALREMARCLKPGGIVILNLPAFAWLRSEHDRAIHTARRYTRRDLEAKLRRAGFVPVRMRYWNWLLFPPLAAVRLLRRVAGAAARARRGAEVADAPRSDLTRLPGWINATLDGLLAVEAHLSGLPVPAGLSLLAVARKD